MESVNNSNIQLWARKDGDTEYTRIDLFPEEPIKLNLSVTNIIDPLSTNSVFSRTFRVPNTQANNKFFKAVFNVNSVSFDASKKVSAYLNDSGAFYTNGNIRLTSTYSNDSQGDVQYEIVFMGETSDFGSQIGGGFLSEVNLTQFNHDQSYSNITSSWNTNPATGVANGLFNGDIVYPLVNWGYTYTNGIPDQSTTSLYTGSPGGLRGFTSASWPLSQSQMKPSIRAKALWDAIFAETEYTYDSAFLESDFFKKLYIISEKQARPELNVSLTFSANNPNVQTWYYATTSADILAPNETSDPNGVWEPATSVYTAQSTSGPTYQFSLSYYHHVNPPNVGGTPYLQMQYTLTCRNAVTNAIISQQVKTANNLGLGNFVTTFFNVSLTAGQKIKFTVEPASTTPFNSTASLNFYGYYISCTNAPEIVTLNSVMPDNIRKIDFMKSIINRFKLVFVPSRDNEKHFTITPWKDWVLQGQSKDWNNLLDTSKDIKSTPLFYGQNRFQVYADQEDADFPNYTYQLSYKQTYGQLNLDSDNELLTGTITVKDQFAPTPLYPIGGAVPAVGSAPSALAAKFLIPWISKADFTAVQNNPIQPKLRLVFYNGKIAAPLNWYLPDDSGAPQQQTIYPLMSEYSYWPAGTSTFDLSWQNKDPLYNTEFGNPIARTGYDTFNVYWKTWYDTNFDPYSRKVELTLVLNYKNMIDLKFNNYYWIKDAWYLVNKITDYVAGQTTPCRVELIKVGNNIGLTIPPTQGVGYQQGLCFSALTYCAAYCCAKTQATGLYWTNQPTLATSSTIWQNSLMTIPANPGFYADSGGTVCEVGPGGNIIAFYIGSTCDPCTTGGLTEFVGVQYSSSTMCTACISDSAGVTLWGDNTTLDTSTYVWTNSAGTIPAPNGWYMDPNISAYAVQINDGVVWSVGLCYTCNPNPPIAVYEAQAYFNDAGAATCDVCSNTNVPVTVWLNNTTWATSNQVYNTNSADNPAAAGYWTAYNEGGVIYETGATGYITGTLDCTGCTQYYYYSAVNCNAPGVTQKFYSTVPINPGQVISSSLFPDQCWTVIGNETSATYLADVIHDDCKSCSETWICNCVEYYVTTDTKGSSYLSYKDCADGSTQYQEIQPGNAYNICMCEGSGSTAEGRVYLDIIGTCTTPPCYVWNISLNSGLNGQLEYEECVTGLIKTLDIEAGADYQVCAVDGTLNVLAGDVTYTQGPLCG